MNKVRINNNFRFWYPDLISVAYTKEEQHIDSVSSGNDWYVFPKAHDTYSISVNNPYHPRDPYEHFSYSLLYNFTDRIFEDYSLKNTIDQFRSELLRIIEFYRSFGDELLKYHQEGIMHQIAILFWDNNFVYTSMINKLNDDYWYRERCLGTISSIETYLDYLKKETDDLINECKEGSLKQFYL